MQDLIDLPTTEPSSPSQLEPLEAKVRELDRHLERLNQLEAELEDLELSFQEACGEEKRILADEVATEKDGIKRLVEARAKRDLRQERVAAGRRRINELVDAIVSDVGPDVRLSFARFGYQLLTEKIADTTAVINDLLPAGAIPGIDNTELVRQSRPVTTVRQLSNWCSGQASPDVTQEIANLRELPRKWLAALSRLLSGDNPFDNSK
jgi:hypothetical protein